MVRAYYEKGLFDRFHEGNRSFFYFCLPGLLYGRKAGNIKLPKWWLCRLKVILTPLWIYLAVLLLVFALLGYDVDFLTWFQYFVPVHTFGFIDRDIDGLGHLWFLSHLFVCYMITPKLQQMKKVNSAHMCVGFGVYFVSTMVMPYLFPKWIYSLTHSLMVYCIGFYFLEFLLEKKLSVFKWLFFAITACMLRVVGRMRFDGTVFYDDFIAGCSSTVLAISIIAVVYQIGKAVLKFEILLNIVRHISSFSYEFYIVHYMFLTGVLRIETFRFKVINVILALMASLIFAWLLKRIASFGGLLR